MGTRNPGITYWAKASPVEPGVTGHRYFYIDQTATIYFSREDFVAPVASGSLPVLGG
ncbi:MAG: hypothetical protein JKY65_18870 [Planctomycetes bacterium]|nr:hypothetical protein [Planctomycetota bacterium]